MSKPPRQATHDARWESEDRSALRRRRSRPIEIIHQDDDLVLVNKPPGTALEDGLDETAGITSYLAARHVITGADTGVYPAYPIDVDASGIFLLTRRPHLAERFREQMADGTLDLHCLAIVRGPVPHESGTIDRPILEDPRGAPARVDDRHGRRAVTRWRLCDTFIGFALLECLPRTSAQYQIRVHLADAGMPLAVDPVYGGASHLLLSSFKPGYRPSRRRPERPLIRRVSLHAASVAFTHPTTGARLHFDAPPPKDFRATLHQLDRFARLPPGPRR